MKVCACPPPPPTPRSSLASIVSSVSLREPCISMLSTIIAKLTCAILTLLSAEVGAILGVLIGAFAGLKTEKGFLHGAITGAANGVILSKKILEILLATWDSNDTVIACFFSLLDSVAYIMSGRYHPQRFNPTKIDEEESEVDIVILVDATYKLI
ncbi:PREDICTED: NEP1-interacting protein 1-like [Populus euphratica]|uniref:NEP1-interacting protein 1-like n=1 Tax=Populus euphratica TaxID=75702 RepID=A0AAJ6T1R7_POPEU|nr:PREDICTED: NEP1-interacting protein 1-like [Populus euphratica]